MTTISVIRTTIASVVGRTRKKPPPPSTLTAVATEPVDAEGGLDVDTDADRRSDLHADHGENSKTCARQDVAREEASLGGALGACRADEVLVDRLGDAGADHAGVEREEEQREGEPGENQVGGPVDRSSARARRGETLVGGVP